MNKKRIIHFFTLISLLLLLSACGAGYYVQSAKGTAEREVICNCKPDTAIRYGVFAAEDIGHDPHTVGPTGFTSNLLALGLSLKSEQINFSVLEKNSSQTIVRIRAQSSDDKEELADRFVSAFMKRAKLIN